MSIPLRDHAPDDEPGLRGSAAALPGRRAGEGAAGEGAAGDGAAGEGAAGGSGFCARNGPQGAIGSDEEAKAAELGLDEELRRVARRDEAALERLYRRTQTALFGRLLRMLPDRRSAEAALVDTFVRVWDKAEQFDSRLGSAWSWLLAVARSRALDALRSERRHASRLVLDLEPARLLDDPVTPAHRVERAERDRAVRAAVRALPQEERELVLRAFFHGRTHVEIAGDVGIPLGTVKSRMRRALVKLEAVLAASDTGADA